jgi:hypothetical protein
MADIALITADKVQVVSLPIQQRCLLAGEDIVAGAPVVIDNTSGGKFLNSDANGAAPRNTQPYGIATHTAKSGQSVTAIRQGPMDGFDLSAVNYGAKVFVSDTVGRIADAAGTATLPVGIVEPALAQPLGTSADKILMVECNR